MLSDRAREQNSSLAISKQKQDGQNREKKKKLKSPPFCQPDRVTSFMAYSLISQWATNKTKLGCVSQSKENAISEWLSRFGEFSTGHSQGSLAFCSQNFPVSSQISHTERTDLRGVKGFAIEYMVEGTLFIFLDPVKVKYYQYRSSSGTYMTCG